MTHSYVSSPALWPYLYETIPERVRHWSNEMPERNAFIFWDTLEKRHTITCRELYEKSTTFAKFLVACGIQKGDIVGVCIANSLDWLVCELGTIASGAVSLHLNVSERNAHDIIEKLNLSECKALLMDTHSDSLSGIWKALRQDIRFGEGGHVEMKTVSTLKLCILTTRPTGEDLGLDLETAMGRANQDTSLPQILPEDLAVLFAKSGRTDVSKIIMHTHFSILNAGLALAHACEISPDDVVFNDRQFGWIGGFPDYYLTRGACRVFCDPRVAASRRRTSDLLGLFEHERCTAVVASSHLIMDILKESERDETKWTVKKIITGGHLVDHR